MNDNSARKATNISTSYRTLETPLWLTNQRSLSNFTVNNPICSKKMSKKKSNYLNFLPLPLIQM